MNNQPIEVEYRNPDDKVIGYWTKGEWDHSLPYQGQPFGALRVWWIPQIPDSNHFLVPVSSIQEAAKVLDILADYDLYQYENNIKPDYSNAGGLEVFVKNDGRGNPAWEDWHDPETGIEDPREYIEFLKKNA